MLSLTSLITLLNINKLHKFDLLNLPLATLPYKQVLLSQLIKSMLDPPAKTEMRINMIAVLNRCYIKEKGAIILLNKPHHLDPCCFASFVKQRNSKVQGTILEEIKQVKLAEGTGNETGLSGRHPSDQQSGDKTALMGVPLQTHTLHRQASWDQLQHPTISS